MTLLPLEQIRLDRRSHIPALSWIWLIYRNPKVFNEAGRPLSNRQRTAAVLWVYLHALPYILLLSATGRWIIFHVFELAIDPKAIILFVTGGLWFHVLWVLFSVLFGLAISLTLSRSGSIALGLPGRLLGGLAIGLAMGFSTGFGVGIAVGLSGGLAIFLIGRLAEGLPLGIATGLAASLAGGVAFGINVGFAENLVTGFASGLPYGVLACVAVGLSKNMVFGRNAGLGLGLGGGLLHGLAFSSDYGLRAGVAIGLGWLLIYYAVFLRVYYLPWHFCYIWNFISVKTYHKHPVSWDDVCLLPFPGLDSLLVAYTTLEPKTGEREIDRLIDEYPSQRLAALRARAILVVRRAAETSNLARLDEMLSLLPGGSEGFLKESSEIRSLVHEITILQARLDTLNRPFLREPFARLLVKEIEVFEWKVAGFKDPFSAGLRNAARNWLELARRQLDDARTTAARESTHQVFRATNPIDRDCEAFVYRAAIGELERQVMLATGCPGLIVYGRRRMGKTTLLCNLRRFLPSHVEVVHLSMQRATAFTSLRDLVNLIAQSTAKILQFTPELPTTLKDLEYFLDETQEHLEIVDRRLLLAIDEYENLDRKIGEGVFPEDLLAVIRESIQAHRRIIWTMAGSYAIDEFIHAPWTSYLVSARTVEVASFEFPETRLLLTEPLQYSSLWPADDKVDRPCFEPGFWGDGGIERIHDETGGWPNLVQLVAEIVVDLVNDSGVENVDRSLLESALGRAVKRGNNFFLEIMENESRLPGEWDYLRAFRTVDEQSPPSEVMTRSLRRRCLVREERGRLRLRVPLMGRWLRERL